MEKTAATNWNDGAAGAMRFDAITLFAPMFDALMQYGVTRRAHERGLWSFRPWNPRDFTQDVHRTVDDRPFGGGPGMVLMAEPLARAVEAVRIECAARAGALTPRVICLSAAGAPLTDARVKQLADEGACGRGLILVCGRYEGIDQRFVEAFVDEEISIGDFVLSGGEVAAMALIDAVVRQLPGALKEESVRDESFGDGQLDAPQYTRPESWRGRSVPPVLLCGDHARIEQWRRAQALERTRRVRPDLLPAGEAADEHHAV
ncbi:MAG TPA: tRNA (guanosine(37)-N1)-methyltransferase TrmD [Burkholderiaceae bacterium]|jgi:tRNA (guanine37-N1)-methyltransferase|nr:tRNA (guanosine(37)-N1)-methyltransferase TrmD [Burkholderiaceae bacterium]